MKTYVMGDIHGEYEKLINCLKAVNFDYNNDILIQLGDVVDRGENSFLVIEELLKIKNLISIQGNHDEAWFNALKNGHIERGLLWKHGAIKTLESYITYGINPEVHFNFFKNQIKYYIDDKNRYFVHGGFNRHYLIDKQLDETVYTWDRDLWSCALSYKAMKDSTKKFKIKSNPFEIYIGHTPTILWDITEPMNAANIWNIDTGSGKGGLLTIMDIDTKQFKQF